MIGTAVTERTQTTQLAAATRYTPPLVSTARPMALGLLMTVPALVVLITMVSYLFAHPGVDHPAIIDTITSVVFGSAFVLAVASPAVIAFGLVRSRVRRNSLICQGRPAAYALWSAGMYCHRCGFCYWPTTSDPRIPARQPLSTSQFRWAVWNAGGYAHV
ncbi:hypothetical protein [Nocardia jiangxiensis]|uniref:hypothetical protein n=1 Tax=Nocardia jiangxiensis TaxID=282685 RepID=UPI0012F6DD30|nr:hypothetical protein [Nocardia jiangxiensis]